MAFNYFHNKEEKRYQELNRNVSDVWALLRDKVEKTTNPAGEKILESTAGGGFKETTWSTDDIEQGLEYVKTTSKGQVDELGQGIREQLPGVLVSTGVNGVLASSGITTQDVATKIDSPVQGKLLTSDSHGNPIESNESVGSVGLNSSYYTHVEAIEDIDNWIAPELHRVVNRPLKIVGIHSGTAHSSSGLKLALHKGGTSRSSLELSYTERSRGGLFFTGEIHNDNLATDVQAGESYTFLLKAASGTSPVSVSSFWIEWFYKYV